MKIEIESAPSLKLGENFAFLLKEVFAFAKDGHGKKHEIASLLAQHADNFDMFVCGSHIAVHQSGIWLTDFKQTNKLKTI